MAEIDLNIIKNKINTSPWSDLQKREILAVLPKMGPKVLQFLELRLSRSDFSLVQNELYATFIDGQKAFESLSSGQTQEFIDFLGQAEDNSTYNFGEYLLPLVLDIKDSAERGKISGGQELDECLNKFQLIYFRKLPSDELEKLFKDNLLYFVRSLNMVMEFKCIYQLAQFSGDDTWSDRLRRALEDNQEMLGQSGLTREGKNYPQTVGNWLKDYFVYIKRPLADRVAFDQVQYIERAPNVQRLNAYERKDLLEIIKLHAWLMNPEVTEAEVEAYEAELAKRAAPVAITAPAEPVTPKPQPKPVMPEFKLKTPNDWVREASLRRAEEQRKIDAKIEELKHKKVGN